MAVPPTVLYPLTLPALLNYVLTSRLRTAHTTLIICSRREDFLQDLARSLQSEGSQDAESLQQLMEPTLHNLLTARHVNISFCASVQALLAYLAAFNSSTKSKSGEQTEGAATLVLVNPLSLHAPSPSFSAQGLSRTFATAVETALRVGWKLFLVETLHVQRSSQLDVDLDVAMPPAEEDNLAEVDPWEQEVPILNVSARRYTTGNGERPWAGRTMRASRVAARWFRFCNVRDEG